MRACWQHTFCRSCLTLPFALENSSEEDNDPMTDDAASTISLNVSRNQQIPTSPLANSRSGGARQGGGAAAARARHNQLSGVISDDGVDSPTYDGDIETSTSARTVHHSSHSHPHSGSGRSSASASVSNLTSPTSGNFPSINPADVRDQTQAPAVTITAASRQNSSADPGPSHGQPVNVAAVPLRVAEEPAPVPVSAAEFNPASLTVEDIREFVNNAIAGGPTEKGAKRTYSINPPPVGRPVRIYADGEYFLILQKMRVFLAYSYQGVYDLFHFG